MRHTWSMPMLLWNTATRLNGHSELIAYARREAACWSYKSCGKNGRFIAVIYLKISHNSFWLKSFIMYDTEILMYTFCREIPLLELPNWHPPGWGLMHFIVIYDHVWGNNALVDVMFFRNPNHEALKLVEHFSMKKSFDCQRMHLNGDPHEFKTTVFGLTSLIVCGFWFKDNWMVYSVILKHTGQFFSIQFSNGVHCKCNIFLCQMSALCYWWPGASWPGHQ